MPNQLFIFFAVIAGALGYFSKRRESIDDEDAKAGDEVEENLDKSDFDINAVKDNSKISLNIGYGLVSLVSQNDVDSLVPSITKLRKEISKRLGFVVPGIRIRDDVDLEPSQYQIKVGKKLLRMILSTMIKFLLFREMMFKLKCRN